MFACIPSRIFPNLNFTLLIAAYHNRTSLRCHRRIVMSSRRGSQMPAIFSCFAGRVGRTMSEGTTEVGVMTEARAATLRVKWNQRATPSPCEHRYLELEGVALGHSTDNYYCIVCGECVVRNHYDSLSH